MNYSHFERFERIILRNILGTLRLLLPDESGITVTK